MPVLVGCVIPRSMLALLLELVKVVSFNGLSLQRSGRRRTAFRGKIRFRNTKDISELRRNLPLRGAAGTEK